MTSGKHRMRQAQKQRQQQVCVNRTCKLTWPEHLDDEKKRKPEFANSEHGAAGLWSQTHG